MTTWRRGDVVVQRADQLAGLPGLERLEVLAGAPGARPAAQVRIVELATDRVAEGELLVCVVGDASSWRLDALIRRCAGAGAAGILLADTTPGPTRASLTLATRMGVPLLVAPADELLAIVGTILRYVAAPEVDEAVRLLRCVHRWRDGERDPEHVLRDVAEEVGGETHLGDGDQAARWAEGLRAGVALAQTFTAPDGHVVVAHPITTSGRQWLVVRLADPSPGLVATAEELAKVAAFYLRGWFLNRRWQLEQDRRLQTLLLAELVAERGHVADGTRRRIAELGWRLDGWHVGLHIGTAEPPTSADRDRLAAALTTAGVPTGVIEHGEGLAGWVTTDETPAAQTLHRLATRLRSCTRALGDDRWVRVGIGRARPGPDGLVRSLEEAREVAWGANARTGGVASADALGVHRLVGGLLGSPTARVFAESALAPIAGDETLLGTLAAYLDCGSSVTGTAEQLGIHRNTVTARLQRIQRALAVDLADPDVRLAFQLACRALNVETRLDGLSHLPWIRL